MLLWIDSFSSYGGTDITKLTDGSWSVISNTADTSIEDDPDGVSTGQTLHLEGASDSYVSKALPDGPVDVVYLGARFWLDFLPTNENRRPWFFDIRNAANERIAYATIDATGSISFYAYTADDTGWTPSLITTSSGPVITAEAWWHIECKFSVAPAGFEVRVEGATVFETSDFTLHEDVTQIYAYAFNRRTSTGSGSKLWIKDHYCCDNGGSVYNTFLGTCSVLNLVPVSDDSFTWTPSTGAVGWSIVDNVPINDAAYIAGEDEDVPISSSFNMENLPVGVDIVKAVMTKVRAGKSDGGEGSVRADFSVGGAYAEGDAHTLGASFGARHDIFIDNSYTPAALDSAKVKVTRTA